jgi:putative holliday junction resolvase
MLERMSLACTREPFDSSKFFSVTRDRDGVVLAFDFGTRRIGVAIANGLTRVARPLATVDAQGSARWASIDTQIKQWAPTQLVVGIPRYPDGTAHEMTARAEKFSRQLEGRFHLPVAQVDERYSTTAAAGAEDVDAAAAAIILQQWLGNPVPVSDEAARGQARLVSAAQRARSAKLRLHPLEGEGVVRSRQRRQKS